ncbi:MULTISPECIES: phosphoenolpyruvate--protein phosphotransferase [unclassified Planococcus (in: firmicutes)]|uniref:phosphoenolpyruvate--protein phosphotransferase n=1 Tax=unclassified Planococcus (in: firmicutes) TaxID=2662419 RepID=UPI000C79A3D4|nr:MULTISPECIES: phosphoenolpyruvate--protein phosphotransferase [unclassified Planococcus (in: firmicutes)]PKG45576.1 phosphoenolpyruvate--protein phosphotransferase [Planococcus sp. Urea-trap-24]PKG88715.1 phosphoenolpyruvate--protein phosphotransferase [Planococcus sp. Urea-3u-39]PKH38567.1 phosphoenolpyruvate--protein phosphotransferase [Planococcus sp. MB-3u-09]
MTSPLSGIAASTGIAIAKAFRLENPELTVEQQKVGNPAEEIARFDAAVIQAAAELEVIQEKTAQQISDKEAAIFGAHLLVLSDPELIGPIKERISADSVNAEFALQETSDMFITMFEAMDNEYMKERAADIRDVRKRLLSHLLGVKIQDPSMIDEEVIVIAEDLTPSDTVQLNAQFVKGFITDIGGRTSHSAILARTLEIPAVVGAQNAMATIRNGQTVIIDGLEGKIIVEPDAATIQEFQQEKLAYDAQKAEWAKLKDEPTVSADGQHVELAANIGTPKDLAGVLEHGAEGIGLYRTEFLYMGRDAFPTEDEQFDAYSKVLKGMDGKPTVVRTLDIGGDKELTYLDLPTEMNPFLGLRAIRLCLEMPELFRTQLRALLRASVHGNLKIMFPMIATVEEFRQGKALLEEEKAKLLDAGIPVSDSIEVGIMVEIPSTAVMADVFAKEVDFFSIGTNDLIQYTMAADRMNERVSYLYQPFNPAILRLVKMVIDAAHKEGKWAGMCGEMAGDEIAIPILLGLGLDEFSMSASSVLKARAQISRLSKQEMASHTDQILALSSSQEVEAYVKGIS